MFPVVARNIFAVSVANSSFAAFYIIYFVAFSAISAFGFAVVLRNHFAALYFIILRHFAVAFLFARHVIFFTTVGCVVARLVVNIKAIAVIKTLIARSIRRAAVLC